jgi:hypothetical protein
MQAKSGTQPGQNAKAVNLSYNATIAAHGTVQFGFQGTTSSGANPAPAQFTLNGAACTAA